MIKSLWLLFSTEIILQVRRSQQWLYPLAFFLIVMCLFPIALTPDAKLLQKFIPGCIWVTALLASFLSFDALYWSDLEDGHLDQLLISALPLSLIVLTKLCAHWAITQLPLIILIPLLGVLFHLSMSTSALVALTLLIGTPMLTCLGMFALTLTLGLKQQGMLLSLIVLPLVTPVLIFSIGIIQQFQAGFSIVAPILFLTGLALITLTLFPVVIAIALRTTTDY